MTKLGNICNILNGYAFKSEKYVDSGIRVIRITNVQKGYIEDSEPKFYSFDYADELSRYILENGDLLMSLTGNVGRVGVLSEKFLPAALNQRVACLRLKDNEIFKPFLFHFLNSDYFEQMCINASKGIAQKNLSTEWLKDVYIPDYSAEQQEQIADTLDKVTHTIDLCSAILEKLDLLVKSRFVEMFGEVGTDPMGFGMKYLGEVCRINPKKTDDKRLRNGLEVSFIPMPAVSENGSIDTSEIRSYDDVKTGFTYFSEGDVLFAKITPCMENGKGAVAVGLCNQIGFGSTEFHVLRPLEGKSNPYWLYTITSFERFRKEAERKMTGSAGQRRVPAKFLEQYTVSVPPIELQEQFAAFVAQTDKSKLAVKQVLEKAETLKKALMQEYFG